MGPNTAPITSALIYLCFLPDYPFPLTTMVAAKSIPQNHLADPFEAVLRPPQGETSAQRDARVLAEQLAKRASDAIDEQLRAERVELKKNRPDVRILLLGQSESGKSTTLKRRCSSPANSIAGHTYLFGVRVYAHARQTCTRFCLSYAHSCRRVPAPPHACCLPGRTNSMALRYLS